MYERDRVDEPLAQRLKLLAKQVIEAQRSNVEGLIHAIGVGINEVAPCVRFAIVGCCHQAHYFS